MFMSEKEPPIFNRSPSGLKIRIINSDGSELVMDVTPDLKLEQVKVMCVGQLCPENSKLISSYDLLQVSSGRILSPDVTIGQVCLRPNEELLLFRRAEDEEGEGEEEDSALSPSAAAIAEATENIPERNVDRPNPTAANEASFSRELQPILISLIEAAQRVLCMSKDAAEIFTRVQEQLSEDGSRYPEASPVLVVQLMEMGFSRMHSEKALKLHSNLFTEAMEWLLTHQGDPVLEEPLPDEMGGAEEIQLVNTESTGTVLETLPPKRVLELFRAYHRRSFRPNELVKLKLMEMGFDEVAVIDALRLAGNDQGQAVDILLNARVDPKLDELQGLPEDCPLWEAIMADPIVQLGLTSPNSLFAFLNILDNPSSTVVWLNNNEVGPMLYQISRLYNSESTMSPGNSASGSREEGGPSSE